MSDNTTKLHKVAEYLEQYSATNKYEDFAAIVGILEEQDFSGIAIKPDGYSAPNGFEITRLAELRAFRKANPDYHIVTCTSDCDGVESELNEILGIDVDDEMSLGVSVYTLSNEIRFVNRLFFLLANKDANSSLTLIEVSIKQP